MPRKKLKKKLKRRKAYDKMSSVEKLSHQALIAMMKKKLPILGVKRGIPPQKKAKGWAENKKRHAAFNRGK